MMGEKQRLTVESSGGVEREESREMTLEEMQRRFCELGLAEEGVRDSLRLLADLAPATSNPQYETTVVAHTGGVSGETSNA
jgi:hypothetical protein